MKGKGKGKVKGKGKRREKKKKKKGWHLVDGWGLGISKHIHIQ